MAAILALGVALAAGGRLAIATIALSIVGSVVGTYFGNPQLGFAIGAAVGGLIDAPGAQAVGRLSDLHITGSSYGTGIPIIYGRARAPGNIIWWSGLKERKRRHGGFFTPKPTTYEYSVDLAVLVCQGPITAIKKIYAEDTLLYDSATGLPPSWIHLYLGSTTQTPDPTIIADPFLGAGNVPAYRGFAYVVFDNLPLKDYGNRVPNFSFVVENLPGYPEEILADGAYVYYRWETGTTFLNDASSAGYHLTDTATPQGPVTTGTGKYGTGVTLTTAVSNGNDALNRVIGVDNNLAVHAFTVETWFRYNGGSAGATSPSKFKYRDSNLNIGVWDLRVQANIFGTFLNASFFLNDSLSGSLNTIHNFNFTFDTNYHHIAVVYTGNAQSLLYIDGALVDTQTAAGNPFLSPGATSSEITLQIGRNSDLDETAYYPLALSAAQILAHNGAFLLRLKHVLSDVFRKVGLTAPQYDVGAATDLITGVQILDRTEARSAIAPALQCYFTDMVEGDGKLKAVVRGGAIAATVEADDMGAVLLESGTPEPNATLSVTRMQELELPFRLEILYTTATNNFQNAQQHAIRFTKTHLQQQLSVSTNLILDDAQARQIAERLLYTLWQERERFETSLPPKYLALLPADAITLPIPGGTARVRIQRMRMALPGPLGLEMVLDEPTVLTQSALAGAINPSPDPKTPIILTTLLAWNNNAGRDEDADTVGFYVAANGTTAGSWDGATLFISRDNGGSYQPSDALADAATYGTATTLLAAGTTTGAFDLANTVDILLTGGIDAPPVTISDAEVIAGGNGAVIGDEYIQYGTVTALGSNSYRLGRLLRGRRGTDAFWSIHKTGERAVLDDGGIHRIEGTASDNGAILLLKAVGAGQSLTDVVTPTSARVYGRELLAYAPIQLQGTRDGPLNLTTTWIRRARKNFDLQPYSDIPLDYSLERYAVSYLSGTSLGITAITKASQCVVTIPAHSFTVGQDCYFTGVVGMIEINGRISPALSISGNDITFDIDTRDFGTFSSGNSWRARRTVTVTAQTAVYTVADQTTDFGSATNPIQTVVRQLNNAGVNGYTLSAFI